MVLLRNGAKVGGRVVWGQISIRRAEVGHNDRFLKALVDGGVDLNVGDGKDETPLIYVGREERVQSPAFPTDSGANVDIKTSWSLDALEICIRYKCPRMVNFVLERGAGHRTRAGDGSTVLQRAAVCENRRFASTILVTSLNDVNLDARKEAGITAQDVWEETSHGQSSEMFACFEVRRAGEIQVTSWPSLDSLSVSDVFTQHVVFHEHHPRDPGGNENVIVARPVGSFHWKINPVICLIRARAASTKPAQELRVRPATFGRCGGPPAKGGCPWRRAPMQSPDIAQHTPSYSFQGLPLDTRLYRRSSRISRRYI